MHEEIEVSISFMGIISMVVSLSTIISSLLSNKLTNKFGTKWVTTISVFLSAVALFGFSYSTNIWMILVFAVPYGLGAGGVDAALNNYVALHYSSKHMSWLHCFWGVGTIISPFVMSYCLANTNWNMGYRIISSIQLAIAIIMLLTLPLWNINDSKNVSKQEKVKSIGIIDAIKIKGVPTLLIAFFCYCATESTVMSWACTYLVEAKGIDEPTAAAFASSFFIGMTVGRFFSGFVMDKLGDKKMIFIGAAVLSIGIFILLIPTSSEIISLIALIVTGLGCAPIYPCIVHSTPNNFGAENSGAIIGIQMACAYLGSTLMAPFFGIIGKHIGFNLLPVYMLIFAILMIVMLNKTFKITNQ